MKIETKKLELQSENKGIKGILKSKQLRRTLLGIVLGAVAGFAFFYFTEGLYMDSLSQTDVIQSLVFGGLFGLFITNSPCARNKC
ncbi:MAG: hypothetical protein V2I31_12430 [Mariniphaga sp.]|jgi:hypothetical protein|nr:hypothetical protein [Mariniphaga sp.]